MAQPFDVDVSSSRRSRPDRRTVREDSALPTLGSLLHKWTAFYAEVRPKDRQLLWFDRQ